jgi:hypothetical protein
MSARPILRLTSVACAFGLGCGNPAYLPEEPPPFDSADLGADGAADGAGDGASDGGEASMGCSAATPGNTDQLIVQSGLDRDAEVYWVDFDCVEQPYGVVVAGGVWQVTTGGGHVWAFRELGSLAYIDHVVVEGDGETTFVLE